MQTHPGPTFRTGLAEEADLRAILELQRSNRAHSADGFVTVEHTEAILRAMHRELPHVVARDDDGGLAGYALSMAPSCRVLLPILEPMFARIEESRERRERLGRYYVMGQICVAERFRGCGVFDALYAEHRARFAGSYDACVTEISVRNPRSLRAHARVGFVEELRYRDATDDWVVVALHLPVADGSARSAGVVIPAASAGTPARA
ncbi:MAG: GNAT family N-acetyltransferase [Polyangia bacterium]